MIIGTELYFLTNIQHTVIGSSKSFGDPQIEDNGGNSGLGQTSGRG